MPFIADRNMRASCIKALKKFDNEIYFSCKHPQVYNPVNTHPDTQIHFVNEFTAFVPPELFDYYRAILPQKIKINKGNKRLGRTYPDDVAYNIARIGKYVILNEKYADEKIAEYYKNEGYTLVGVTQGYVKCNLLTDGKYSVTEDAGIYATLLKYTDDILKIPTGSVKLVEFPYGFIGGASGNAKNKIFLCGTMKNQEIFRQISDFFKKNKTEVISLDEYELTDYGSIVYFE